MNTHVPSTSTCRASLSRACLRVSKPCFTHRSFYLTHRPPRPGWPIATAYSAGVLRDKGRLFPVCFATLPTSISGVRPVGLDRYAPSEARVRFRLDPYIRPSEPFGSPPGRSKTISGGLLPTGGQSVDHRTTCGFRPRVLPREDRYTHLRTTCRPPTGGPSGSRQLTPPWGAGR